MSAWTYVEDGMPENGVSVAVTFKDRGGRRRATVATYYGEQELESVDQDDRCGGVYDEDTDKYWAPPGWYETPWSAEEVYPVDGEVTAWTPLAVAPEKTAAEEPSEVVEPAPAPARWRCEGCGAGLDHPGYRLGVGVVRGRLVHTDDGCGPVVHVTEAQPAGAAEGEAG